MIWLMILALLCLIAGIITGIVGLRSIRSKSYPQAEISWKQLPLSHWRYETLNMTVISIHSFGLACLAVILLVNLAMNWDNAFLPALDALDSTRPVSRILGLLAMAFTTFVSGSSVAFHFVQQWIKPASYGINEDGLFYGGSHILWSSFSQYEIGPDDGLISLYSSYSPRIRTWVLHPPVELFTSVLGMIQKKLPMKRADDDQIHWQRSPAFFVSSMSTLIVIGLLPAVWGLIHNQFWVWGYAFMAFFVVQDLGVRLITRFNVGSNKRNQQTFST